MKQLIRLATMIRKLWVKGNNSGDPNILRECHDRADRLVVQHDRLARKLGYNVEWPGLYPHYTNKHGLLV